MGWAFSLPIDQCPQDFAESGIVVLERNGAFESRYAGLRLRAIEYVIHGEKRRETRFRRSFRLRDVQNRRLISAVLRPQMGYSHASKHENCAANYSRASLHLIILRD